MAIQWTIKARDDLVRVHAFLAPVNPAAARRVVQIIATGVRRLAPNPRLGSRLEEFEPREVRSIVIGDYELRYELRAANVIVLRIWHAREHR